MWALDSWKPVGTKMAWSSQQHGDDNDEQVMMVIAVGVMRMVVVITITVVALLLWMVTGILCSRTGTTAQVLVSNKPPFTDLLCSGHTSRALHSTLEI